MVKKSHRNRYSQLAMLIALVAGGAQGQTAKTQETLAVEPLDKQVVALNATLRSRVLQEEVSKQAQNLVGPNGVDALAAADFFYDLRGKNMLIFGLANSRRSFAVQIRICEALNAMVPAGDLLVANVAVRELEQTVTVTFPGGIDTKVGYDRYRFSLAKLLGKVTGLRLTGGAIGTDHDGLTKETGAAVLKDVRQWLERQESKSPGASNMTGH